MKKINLLKRMPLSIDEFRAWLNQLIQDKKGALPDLNDWKLIKEQLDRVGSRRMDDDGTGYSILRNDDMEYEPYDFNYTVDLLDRLCDEAEMEYADGLYNDVNYFLNKPWISLPIPEWYYDELPSCAVRDEE